MQIGNVIIADGKVGVITSYFMPPYKMIDGKAIGSIGGQYLDGSSFHVGESVCIFLDECLNDYINRHVRKFGKLKISSRGKNGKSNG